MFLPSTRRFRSAQAGNLTITTSIVGLMLATAVGASLDGARMMSSKSDIKAITDAAALAAAMPEKLSAQARKAAARSMIETHAAKVDGIKITDETIVVRNGGKEVEVSLAAEIPLLFGGLLGRDVSRVSAASLAIEDMSASMSDVSISVVLDLSESMNDRFDTGSRLASVKAALSDTFDLISNRYGGEAAAETRFSTGLYPFNWGMVDDDMVGLEAGSAEVLREIAFLGVDEGSVPGEAMEIALEGQLEAAKTEGKRDRYIVWMTDGDVDNEKADEKGRFLPEHKILEADGTPQCQAALADVANQEYVLAEAYLKSTQTRRGQNDVGKRPRQQGGGNGTDAQTLANTPDQLLAVVGDLLRGTRGTPGHRKQVQAALDALNLFKQTAIEFCEPMQTQRVIDVCEEAADNDISMIAIDLSGEDQSARAVTEMCVGIMSVGEETGEELTTGETKEPSANSMTTETLPGGLTITVSEDGESIQATVSTLAELRQVLATMTPETGPVRRTVRLVH
ncbi:MAG: pilus assembly protein TadG-related protein [Litorimonas sp.]